MSKIITRMLENEERSRTVLAAVAALSGVLGVVGAVVSSFAFR